MAQIQTNDAAGGAGSFTQNLLGIALNGLSRTVDGALSKRYPLTSFNETETINAAGQVKPSSAPQKDVSATDKTLGVLSSPLVITGVAAVVVLLVVLVVVRRR